MFIINNKKTQIIFKKVKDKLDVAFTKKIINNNNNNNNKK